MTTQHSWRRTFTALVVAGFISVIFAGCTTSPSEVTYEFVYAGAPGDTKGTFSVPTGAVRVRADAAGTGNVLLMLSDGSGQLVYEGEPYRGGTVSGVAGNWTMALDFQAWLGDFRIWFVPE